VGEDSGGSGADDLETAQALLGPSPQILFTEIQGFQDDDISLTGDDLLRAFASQRQATGAPIVNIQFNERGTRIFGNLTEQIVLKQQQTGQRDRIAIFLDDDELIAPTVQTAITSGAAFIEGRDFTIDRVRDIALLLESGSLPLSIDLILERNVDAILGADSLKKSVVAGLVGLALVLFFMTSYYRVPGVIASVALLVYAVVLLAIFKAIPVTLTLSGVAAVILSVGMAVDANILIFERMKEELRAGRTLMSAINLGFNRAWPAIRDGNVSTLITCGILFWFADRLGTSIVQGFAAALAIGVAFSMVSAIVVSRTMLRIIATTRIARRLGIFVPPGGGELPQQTAAAPATQRS
jgi:preprotein translocase subunit SecD